MTDAVRAMQDEAGGRDGLPSVRHRLRKVSIGVALLLTLAGAILWGVRKLIAEHVIGGTLAARHVPTRYTLADLGFGRQRLTNVVIGDPAHPDLVADWIETETGIGLSGPELAGVRVGHVRLRARMIGGRPSFGSIDRLIPASSGKPFALPAIDVRIGDARVRLETPQGVVGMRIAGAGRLDTGFRGSLAVASDGLRVGACGTGRVSAVLAVATVRAGPSLRGPLRMASLRCAGIHADGVGADIAATLNPAFTGWHGRSRLNVAALRGPAFVVQSVTGDIAFAGDARSTDGTIDLATHKFAGSGWRGAGLVLAGRYAVAGGAVRYDGRAGARGLVLPGTPRAAVERMVGRAAGTPVAPLLDRFATAVVAAGAGFDLDTTGSATWVRGSPYLAPSHLAVRARSGAHADLTGSGIGYDGRQLAIGRVQGAFGGGGLPNGTVTIASSRVGRFVARAVVRPYAVGTARLALTLVRVVAAGGTVRLATTATLSGPVGGGRVEGLAVPLDLRWDGTLRVGAACTPVAFERLALSGLVLAPARVTLCPTRDALLRTGPASVAMGARLEPVVLAGGLGRSRLRLTAAGGRIDSAGFVLDDVATRIGDADRATRIDVARLAGDWRAGGAAGTFGNAGGRIGTVQLRLGDADGDWRFAGGRLTLGGALAVSDTAPVARFKPLAARNVAFALDGDRIAATATLYEPATSTRIADVAITHALSTGTGHADLTVPGIAFTEGFQPDRLTPLTFGVIADVRGTIDGAAHIAWTGDGVTSTGDFGTAGTDLAAAFGPVSGIAGRVRFTDLLSLESAAGQVARVKTINPGIPVTDGVLRYQLLPGARVRVERGDWPFAGGTLGLDPTLLDFSAPAERRMTFHVAGVAADRFLQQFDFKNLDASGIFDGVLPMIFDAQGGRIEGGSLTVRSGGGTLAYVGEIGQKDLGLWGNIAFQALKSLRYRSLGIAMNGPLAGEMVTEVSFAGISQGQGAKSNFLIRRLQRLPFVFNIRIKAPFRGLLDSAQSFYDPKRLVQRNLPALLEAQDKAAAPPIQPPASRIVP